MKRIKGLTAPFFICDVCKTPINHANYGAAIYPKGETAIVIHAHKGICHNKAEDLVEQSHGERPGWVELQHHIMQLVYNTHLTPEDIKKEESGVLTEWADED
jgi:hypothetical protein